MKQEKLCETEDMTDKDYSRWYMDPTVEAKFKEELGAENEKRQAQSRQDSVNQPNHYTAGGIEVIDYIRAKLTPDQLKGYYVGNLLKYLSRADHKGGVEDYKKAQVYLRWLIELEENRETRMGG
jgi:hypothetical protein